MFKQKRNTNYPRWKQSRSQYRLKRRVLHRVALAGAVCCALLLLRLHLLARHSLQAKYTTTRFDDDAHVLILYRDPSEGTSRKDRIALIASKSDWQSLGSGYEGSTFTWNESVVKTFKQTQSPFRSCLPSTAAGLFDSNRSDSLWRSPRWPTEIPASLVAGGEKGFLPVKDFFFFEISSPGNGPQWHLVTPLIEGGTLKTLAKRVSQSLPENGTSVQDLDIRFRPQFNELLRALERLHARGLCHDDVKPENIFIDTSGPGEEGRWLLGDLGNVREVTHPYHRSRLWTYSSRQLPDCRANDALRAVKSYVRFLRQASATGEASSAYQDFDKALFVAVDPEVRLLWRADAAGSYLRVENVLRWSEDEEQAENTASVTPMLHRHLEGSWLMRLTWLVIGLQGVYDRESAAMLEMGASEAWTRKLALTWFLGVPVQRC